MLKMLDLKNPSRYAVVCAGCKPSVPMIRVTEMPPVLHRRAGAAIWSTMTRDVVASLQGGGRSG